MQQIDGQYSEFNPSEITNYGDGAIVRFPSGIRKIAQLPIPWLSDKNGRYHNEQVCKQFKQKHGLYFAPGKENVKQDRLKEPDKTKCEIYNVIKNGLNHAKDWQQLQYHLSKERIQIRFKYKGHTNEAQGISFIKGEYSFKGSEIDRNFSYSKLEAQLKVNNQYLQETITMKLDFSAPKETNIGSSMSGRSV